MARRRYEEISVSGLAALAALRKLVESGKVKRDDTVVLFTTGTPLKNPSPPRHAKVSTVDSAKELIGKLGGKAA